MSIFEGGSSGRYSQATTDKIKKNIQILQQNQNLQVNKLRMSFHSLTLLELRDNRELVHT